MDYICYVICGIVLIICSIQDIKHRRISILIPVIAALIVFAIRIIPAEIIDESFFLALIPGIIMTVLAYFMRGKVGYGDGTVLCLLGGSLGLYRSIVAIGLSFILVWSACMVIAVTGRTLSKETSFPYIPFVLGGTVITLLLTDVAGWL